MFTRRSVLNLISSWVERKLFVIDEEQEEDNTLKLRHVETILTNAVDDFDWETRLACLHLLLVIVRTHQEKSVGFCCSIFDRVVSKSSFDVEVKVKEKTLQCLHELQRCLKSNDEKVQQLVKIENMEQFKTRFFEYQKEEKWCLETLRSFLSLFDFSRLLESLRAMDEHVQQNAVSFMDDILASVHKKDANLLIDCY